MMGGYVFTGVFLFGGGSRNEFSEIYYQTCASLNLKLSDLDRSNFPEFHGAEDYIGSRSQQGSSVAVWTAER